MRFFKKARFVPLAARTLILLPLAMMTPYVESTAHASQHEGSDSYPAVSDSDLQAFVHAHKRITEIRTETRSELRGVQDEEQAKELQQHAQTEMMRTLDEVGLTVARYSEIVGAVKTDEDLRKKFEDIVERLPENRE
ncbi:MAG TPA: DUF4168 domain-containing protein [Candidatus Binatia bacterium]